jgi:hypothetical protein
VTFLTLSTGGKLDADRRNEVEEIVRRSGGTVHWNVSARTNRTFALLHLQGESQASLRDELLSWSRAAHPANVYDGAIIGFALYPSAPQALPAVAQALGGSGRPAGVVACTACPGGLIVEFDPLRTSPQMLLDLVEIELERWGSAREMELLTPLPDETWALVAAQGVQAPELTAQCVLDRLLECEAADAS